MSSSAQIADPELTSAFQELSLKKAHAESQIRIANVQIESLQRKIQHSAIVEQEVKTLPGGIKLYKSVGRMFELQAQTQLLGDMKKKQQTFADKIKSIEGSKEYLEKNIEECKNNVRELVMSKQNSR